LHSKSLPKWRKHWTPGEAARREWLFMARTAADERRLFSVINFDDGLAVS
jgi:hypothetical protein